MLARVWIAVCVAIAVVAAMMAVLCTLQYDQILSQLVRQRLGVTVEAAATPFRSVVEMGLPASMVRNGQEILARARQGDPAISAIELFNPSGIVVAATPAMAHDEISEQVLGAQQEAATDRWSIELADRLVSGVSIRNDANTVVAGILASYPNSEFTRATRQVGLDIGMAAAGIGLVLSLLALPILRWRLSGLRAALRHLDGISERLGRGQDLGLKDPTRFGKLQDDFSGLVEGLERANAHYGRSVGVQSVLLEGAALTGQGRRVLVSVPESRLARRVARQLSPLLAALILGAVLLLGIAAYQRVDLSLGPEFTARTKLIGAIARDTIARTVEAGVPLDSLVGATDYFSHLLEDFPEISYLAISTDRPIVEAGTSIGGVVTVLPLGEAGAEAATITFESNPRYLSEQFRSIVLDLAVVVIVGVLLAFELVVLVIGGAVTGPLDRVLHLVGLQAAGDFSKRLGQGGREAINRIGSILSQRAERLHARRTATAGPSLADEGSRVGPPEVMRFCTVGDVRLALFLFAAADQLPLSFFSLFCRDVVNPIRFIDSGLAISLPLAAYLLAALFGAAAARPLSHRFGHRGQFLVAALMTLIANVGLCLSDDLVAVIAWSALNGIGFALASLACQDYAIDRLPKENRARSIGLVSGALFAGVFAGTALGGVIADRIGQRPVFLVAASLVLISALLILWLMPSAGDRVDRDDPEPAETFSLDLVAPLGSFGYAALTIGILVPQIVADQVFVSYLVSLALNAAGASVADIARLMMVYFLVLIVAGHVAVRLPARLATPGPLVICASLISGVALLVPLLSPSFGGYFAAAVGAGFGHGLSRGPLADLIVRFADGPLAHLGSSSVLGASRVLERGGSVAGLLAVGALTSVIGYAGATAAMAALLLGGAGLFALSRPAPLAGMTAKQGETA